MKVFIENIAYSKFKNIYNEKPLQYINSIEVARAYPFPYGFVLNTTAEDGDNIDAFVLTKRNPKAGQIVDCEPIALMEQFEKSWDPNKSKLEEIDHKVIMVLIEEKDRIFSLEDKNLLSALLLYKTIRYYISLFIFKNDKI